MKRLKPKPGGPPSMAIFIFRTDLILRMEAGIRKDRKGLLSGLQPSMRFLFYINKNNGKLA